jgi:hypothetical protein
LARPSVLVLALLSLVSTVSPSPVRAAEPGTAGALFLRLGVGGRASGMGEAFTAIADDASATYWNPAGMTAIRGTQAVLMHNEWIQDLRLEHAGLVHETDWGSFGFFFTGFYTGDIDRYEDAPLSRPLGTFSAFDLDWGVAYARQILPSLSVGLAVKHIYGKIDEESTSGVAVDLGVHHLSRIKGVRFAAVIQHLGPTMKYVSESYDLPLVAKLGAAYHRRFPSLEGDLELAVDLVFPNDDDARQHLGAELTYRDLVSVRGGVKVGYDSQGPTLGVGVHHGRYRIDYAALFISNDLGDSHRISLGLDL